MRVVTIPDAHHPFVDKGAWELMLTGIEQLEPDHIVIIGDFADFNAVSSHPRNPNLRKLDKEIHATNEALDQVDDAGGEVEVTYHEGNHEDRLRLFLWNKAPELYNMANVPDLLCFKERGYTSYRYREFSNIGKVFFSHGWRTGVNTARQTVLDAGRNIVVGHSHRASIATSGEIAGKKHFCMNIGWLGDVEEVKDWASIGAYKDWQHAFGYIDIEGDYAAPVLVPIIETSKHKRLMILEGKTFKA